MSTPGSGPHPSPEELDLLVTLGDPLADDPVDAATADTVAEVGDDPVLARTAAHAARCPTCRDAVVGMSEVRALLRSEGRRTPPLPPGLQDRITLGLARESARRVPRTEGAGTVAPLAEDRGDGAADRSQRVPRWLAVAAGLVVLSGAAVTATALLGDDARDGAGFATGGAGAENTQDAGDADGSSGAGDGRPGQTRPPADPGVLTATGTDYAPATLEGQVRELVATPAPLRDDPGAAGGAGGDLGPQARSGSKEAGPTGGVAAAPLARRDGLAACLDALGAPGAAPLAVDLARWQGADAAVIVLPPQNDVDGDRMQVWVVDAECGPDGGGLIQFARVSP